MRGWAVVLVGVGLCAGCAGPVSQFPDAAPADVAAEQHRQLLAQARDYYAQRIRVDNVAFQIRTANTRFCKGRVAPQIGLFAATVRSLPEKYHSVAAEVLNLDWDTPRAVAVADHSPAVRAGIRSGDDILAFNDDPVPAAGTGKWIADHVKAAGAEPIRLSTRRNGKMRTSVVYPVTGCSIPIELKAGGAAGAFTDDRKIVIRSGILRLTRSDADIAVIIGHELAHVNLGHRQKRWQNAMLGEIGGAMIDGVFGAAVFPTRGLFRRHFERMGALAYSVGFEREADYVGAYYAARAGYDISGVENIWRALALESPNSIQLAITHPTTPARFVFMRKTIAEIEDKERRHLPLLPELKVAQARIERADDSSRY